MRLRRDDKTFLTAKRPPHTGRSFLLSTIRRSLPRQPQQGEGSVEEFRGLQHGVVRAGSGVEAVEFAEVERFFLAALEKVDGELDLAGRHAIYERVGKEHPCGAVFVQQREQRRGVHLPPVRGGVIKAQRLLALRAEEQRDGFTARRVPGDPPRQKQPQRRREEHSPDKITGEFLPLHSTSPFPGVSMCRLCSFIIAETAAACQIRVFANSRVRVLCKKGTPHTGRSNKTV